MENSPSDHGKIPWRQEVILNRGTGDGVEATLETLSRDGLSLLVDTELFTGEKIGVHVVLPNRQDYRLDPVDLDCRVRYVIELTHPSKRLRAGLRIEAVAERDRGLLEGFLADQARRARVVLNPWPTRRPRSVGSRSLSDS